MPIYREDNSHDGKFSSRGGIKPDLHITHTTEGHEAGDLQALTGPNVSVHDYAPARPGIALGSPEAVIYTLVYWDQAAWHCGYGKLGGKDAAGPWTDGWNERTVGLELGHVQGEKFSTEHLVRSFTYSRHTVRSLGIPRMLRHRDIAYGRPEAYGGHRSDPTDFPFWDNWAKLAVLPAYPIKGAPDIGQKIWAQKLAPIMGAAEAQSCYQAAVGRGFRPGPLLAMIGAESSFGIAGVATKTKSWGNTRTPIDKSRLSPEIATADGWPIYSSWEASLLDVMDRLEHPSKPYLSIGNEDLTTIRMVWAPYGDSTNDPLASSYKQLGWIAEWITLDAWAPAPSPIDPATPQGTYPVSSVFLEAWLKSGGIWQPNQLTPGYALSQRFLGKEDGLSHQIFERSIARQEADGKITWLLLREAEKLLP